MANKKISSLTAGTPTTADTGVMVQGGVTKKYSFDDTPISAPIQAAIDTIVGGTVIKVGTPTDNQVGVWTGDGTIEGQSEATFKQTVNLEPGVDIQAYSANLTTWSGIAPGTGVVTALAVNTGDAGSVVINGGALGTPISGVVTNLTGTFANDIGVPDEAYGAGWNGSVEVPTKNAIYDKIETLAGGNKVVWLAPLTPDTSTNGSYQSIGANDEIPVVVLADGLTRGCRTSWAVPSDFTSLTSVEMYWTTPAAAKNMAATFWGMTLGDGDPLTGGTSDTIAMTTYPCDASANRIQVSDITAVWNGLTFTSGKSLILSMKRIGGDASDTLSDSAYIIGFRVIYA